MNDKMIVFTHGIDFDVSAVAQKYGGSGHKLAVSFKAEKLLK